MDGRAIGESARHLGAGANCPAGHLADFAPQWGMVRAVQASAGAIITAAAPAVPSSAPRRAMKAEGDGVRGHGKSITAAVPPASASTVPTIPVSLAVDAAMRPAVPQAAMVDDMPETMRR